VQHTSTPLQRDPPGLPCVSLSQELQGAHDKAARAESRLDAWLASMADQASVLTSLCEEVMRGDPDAPASHFQTRLLGIENLVTEKTRASARDAGGGDAAVSGNGCEGAAIVEAPSQDASRPVLAFGRLAQGALALSEEAPGLVQADWQWEQLCDCFERFRDWGLCLMDKKNQVDDCLPIWLFLTRCCSPCEIPIIA